MTSPLRPFATLAIAASALVLLAGCTSGAPSAEGTADPSGGATPSAQPSTDASAEPVEEPTPEPIPFAIGCDELLTAQQVYDFNPNFGTNPGYEPADPSLAHDVVTADAGTACSWLNQTSGETIEIAVATLPAEVSERYKNTLVMNSNYVPTYGDEAYFEVDGTGAGAAQVFSGDYYITAVSTAFYEPGDAQPLLDGVLANLS